MTTLQGIRDLVRDQTDLDEEDLPDSRLDTYIKDSFDRTFAVEERWPFFQANWTLLKAVGEATLTLPIIAPLVSAIERVRDANGYNLTNIAQQAAEDFYQGVGSSTSAPLVWSEWGGLIYLWPTPASDAMSFTLRGFRKPTWSGDPASELDGDSRLHQPILWHSIALAYAQMEDVEIEADYMQRWGASLAQLRKDIMRSQSNDPLILHGGLRPTPRPTVLLNLS